MQIAHWRKTSSSKLPGLNRQQSGPEYIVPLVGLICMFQVGRYCCVAPPRLNVQQVSPLIRKHFSPYGTSFLGAAFSQWPRRRSQPHGERKGPTQIQVRHRRLK